MLVSATEMLKKAKAGHYAVGQFNINNLEWTKSILLTAQELKSPVILGVSEGAGKYMTGFKTVAAMVKAMDEELGITVPVALHLDHGTYEGCYKCIKAGFTSTAPPWNATRPSVTWMFCAPRRLTSKFSVDSVPKKQGATMV